MSTSDQPTGFKLPGWAKTVGIILGILILISIFLVGPYNNMVKKDENVGEKWSRVEAAYQRRADLIPNLVNTVKGYAEFEQETLTKVIEARAKATGITLTADELTPENMAKFQEAQGQLNGALSRLLVAVERYPDLKANQNFLELQAQLEGTENRINKERNDFTASVKDYNTYIRKFPNNFMAGIFGFDRKGNFEADAGAEVVPDVSFE